MVDRPAHLIFIRPLSTSGLLPAARAPSQDPPGIQNPRIVLLSDSISSGDGGGGGVIWWGMQRAWCSAGIFGHCSCLSSFGSLPPLLLSAGKGIGCGYINQRPAFFEE